MGPSGRPQRHARPAVRHVARAATGRSIPCSCDARRPRCCQSGGRTAFAFCPTTPTPFDIEAPNAVGLLCALSFLPSRRSHTSVASLTSRRRLVAGSKTCWISQASHLKSATLARPGERLSLCRSHRRPNGARPHHLRPAEVTIKRASKPLTSSPRSGAAWQRLAPSPTQTASMRGLTCSKLLVLELDDELRS